MSCSSHACTRILYVCSRAPNERHLFREQMWASASKFAHPKTCINSPAAAQSHFRFPTDRRNLSWAATELVVCFILELNEFSMHVLIQGELFYFAFFSGCFYCKDVESSVLLDWSGDDWQWSSVRWLAIGSLSSEVHRAHSLGWASPVPGLHLFIHFSHSRNKSIFYHRRLAVWRHRTIPV